MADHFVINALPRLHQPVRERVRLDELRSEFDKHFADNRFTARDAARQPDSEQEKVTRDGTNLS